MARKLPDEMREALEEAFNDIDVDKSGRINRKELRAALQLIGQNPTNEDMKRYMPNDDSQEEFDKETFVKFVEENVNIKTPEEIDEELIKAFAKFDANENHQIDQEEFRNILTSHTMGDDPLTKDEADELLNSLDVDGDGQLNVLELAKLFSSNIAATSKQ